MTKFKTKQDLTFIKGLINSFIFLAIFMLPTLGFSAQIQKVSGKKVLILLEGDEFAVEDKVFAFNEAGKKKAILIITQVKGSKAIAKVLKGNPEVDMQVGGDDFSAEKSDRRSGSGRRKNLKLKVGVIGGISNNSMSIKVTSVSATYSGMSFALSGFADYSLSSHLKIRGKGGLHQFTIEGQGSSASFSYLSFEGGLNYYLSPQFWLGGGASYLLAASKSSNISVLDSGASTNNLFFIGAGYDISLKQGFIPISFEYGIFPEGAGVSASSILIRAGYGWNF